MQVFAISKSGMGIDYWREQIECKMLQALKSNEEELCSKELQLFVIRRCFVGLASARKRGSGASFLSSHRRFRPGGPAIYQEPPSGRLQPAPCIMLYDPVTQIFLTEPLSIIQIERNYVVSHVLEIDECTILLQNYTSTATHDISRHRDGLEICQLPNPQENCKMKWAE